MNGFTAYCEPYLSGKHGVLWSLRNRRIVAGDDNIYGVIAAMRSMDLRAIGSGAGLLEQEAREKAVGEAIERYCLTTDRPLVNEYSSDLSGEVFKYESIASFSDEQLALEEFPYCLYNSSRKRDWYKIKNLANSKAIWYPARLIFVSDAIDDNKFGLSTSTGAACHISENKAILSGIYEVVERDAFTIAWESKSVLPAIDICSDWQDPFVKRSVIHFDKTGRKLLLRDMTTDIGIPSVLALIKDQHGRMPALAVGCSTNRTLRQACSSATSEAIQTWAWMHEEMKIRPRSLTEVEKGIIRPDAMIFHPLLYSFSENLKLAEHLFEEESKPVINECTEKANDLNKELRWARAKIQKAGFNLFYADLTLDELKPLNLIVTKVVIPGLVPLSAGKYFRHLGNERISTIPKLMGWRSNGPSIESSPHPLP